MLSQARERKLHRKIDRLGRVTENSVVMERICDAANLLIGIGLFVSPWILGFGARAPNVPTQSAGVSGAFIAVLSFAALYAFEVWEEWLILFVAVCALGSPWIFHFTGTSAIAAHLCAGTLSVLLVFTRLRLWSAMSRTVESRV